MLGMLWKDRVQSWAPLMMRTEIAPGCRGPQELGSWNSVLATLRLRWGSRMAIGTPFLLQPCNNICWHLFSSATLHAVITASHPGNPAETLTPPAVRLQQSPGGSWLSSWTSLTVAMVSFSGGPGTWAWEQPKEMWQGWEIPGLECCCNTVSLFPWSCGARVTGQGGFAGIVRGTRALAGVSQYPLCSLTTPLGEKSLIVSSYLKMTPNWSPS